MKNGNKEFMVRLSTPLILPSGEVKEELSVDMDELSWADLHSLEIEYGALFPTATPTNGIYFTDTKYQAMVIARINGMIYDNIVKLKARDAFNLSNRLGRFLNIAPSGPVTAESSSTVVPLGT